MKKIILAVSIIVIVIINSCGEGITEPQPGRRDYVWSVDTISSPPNLFYMLACVEAAQQIYGQLGLLMNQ